MRAGRPRRRATCSTAAIELSATTTRGARELAAYVLGQLGIAGRAFPDEQAAALSAHGRARARPRGARRHRLARSATSASRYGHESLLAPARARRPARARGRRVRARRAATSDAALDALIELSADPEPGVRDWATFALGTLAPQDTPALRDALAARLDDPDDDTRLEAVHGLALRGDAARVEPALDLLGEVGPHDDGGNAADTIWKRYALTQATVRLAALTGDARLKEHLPALDERLMGTAIEGDLRIAYDRVGDDG